MYKRLLLIGGAAAAIVATEMLLQRDMARYNSMAQRSGNKLLFEDQTKAFKQLFNKTRPRRDNLRRG